MAPSGCFLRKGRHGAALQRFHGGLVGGKANPFDFPYPKPLHDDGQKSRNRFGCIALFWLSAANMVSYFICAAVKRNGLYIADVCAVLQQNRIHQRSFTRGVASDQKFQCFRGFLFGFKHFIRNKTSGILIQRLQMNRLRHIRCKFYNGQSLFVSSFIVSPEIPFSVKIHSCHTGFTMDHTKKAPAVSLIKRGMVRDKIERIYPVFFHIRAHMMKQRTCNTIPAAVFFRINGADVGRQILSIVKIIFNDSQPSDDSVARHGQIPLRHNTIPGKAVLHTLQIRIQRNPPFFVKPLRRFFFICRFVF